MSTFLLRFKESSKMDTWTLVPVAEVYNFTVKGLKEWTSYDVQIVVHSFGRNSSSIIRPVLVKGNSKL